MTPEQQRAALRGFFVDQMETLELTTGSNQFIRIQQMAGWQNEFEKLLKILVDKCMADPFDKIPAATKMRLIADQMVKDPHFASPPFGQVSGFNAAILHRWLNAFWSLHFEQIQTKSEKEGSVPPYSEYVEMCKEFGMPPASKEEYDKPVSDEKREQYVSKWQAELMKFGDQPARKDGIKDHRVQAMKDGLEKIECKHPPELIQVVDKETGTRYCLDCGKQFEPLPKVGEVSEK